MALIEAFVAGRSPPELYQAYLAPLFESWSEAMIDTLPPKGRALDLACGTGIVSRAIAQQPGVDHVVAVDIAEPMIAAAQRFTGPDARIAYQVGSATDLPFADCSFDSIYCQQGLQFFPDKLAALNEMGRLLDRGAQAAITVWTAAADGNPVFGAFEDIVAARLGADLVPFGPFSFGDRGKLEALLRKANLKIISLERIERVVRLPDPRTLVLFDLLFLGRPQPDGTMHPLFDPQDSTKDAEIEALIAELTAATVPFAEPDGTLVAPSTAYQVAIEREQA